MKLARRILFLSVVSFSFSIFNSSAMAEDLKVSIDGSSTVYPVTEAVAEEFGAEVRGARITVGVSGTGGGFKKFCRGETDISDASRPIKEGEAKLCKEKGITYVELPVAFDAISVVVNPKNTWAKSITISELKKLWEPSAKGKITKWSQVREGWPEEEIDLFGPGVDSGTFDYFTEVVVGESQASRSDFTSSEDDNIIVQGVASSKNALGFFGLSYYEENKSRVRALLVYVEDDTNGAGPQEPNSKTVLEETYRPLSRPLYIYVSGQALQKPIVKKFTDYYLENAAELSAEVGYVPLPTSMYVEAKSNLEKTAIAAAGANKTEDAKEVSSIAKERAPRRP